jgi:competence protein ComEA
MAGGFVSSAEPAGVNLAQRAGDGDEIYVPTVGEAIRPNGRRNRSGARHPATAPQLGSVDVNRADASELAAVPGIGRALGARIVELREREGTFASLDELLDIAGMTQSRLERARPYLRP